MKESITAIDVTDVPRHQFWTACTALGRDSIWHFFSGAGDIITAWSRDFDKSLYLQLWIGS